MAKEYTYRDIEKYQQALQKAINSNEVPVKQKHVRSAIIGTFHTQGARTFWAIVTKLPAMEDQIVAWKLCHVVHKILREGHPLCLVDSQRHVKDLDEIGKLWSHLNDGYGRMIRLYASLLMTKLEFHKRNPRFPGHLGVTPEELESIAGNDINNYFEMSVEMFDYLDNILDLQAAVFGSLNMARSNSMTNTGQCRLSPLVPCIQDASKLYDYCVKILFRLHYALPPDTLTGHRDRFMKIFRILKEFYNNTTNLQYFKDLISIPSLPNSPPNFLIQSEFRTYVTQEVVVPQEPEEEPPAEGNLIDTTESDHAESSSTISQTVYEQILSEKEFLKNQCEKLSLEINGLVRQHRNDLKMLESKIKTLETELVTKDHELIQEKKDKEDLMTQAFAAVQSKGSEQKAKDEKFQKLKDFYYKLRDEHIQKLREKAEIEKRLRASDIKLEQIETEKKALIVEINELSERVNRAEEQMQQTTISQIEELEELRKDKELFNMETEILKKSINDHCRERDDYRAELTLALQEKNELKLKTEELTDKLSTTDVQISGLKKEKDILLEDVLSKSVNGSMEVIRHAVMEMDNPAFVTLTCSPDYLMGLKKDCVASLESSKALPRDDIAQIIVTSNEISNKLSMFILYGGATCNTSHDISFSDKMSEYCKGLGEITLSLLECLKKRENTNEKVSEALSKLEEISSCAESISSSSTAENKENLADMLENEMIEMDRTIEEAAKRIQEMLEKSRADDSGIKLEVNSRILDSCTTLMQAVRVLVQKSRSLQAEIVLQGKGTSKAKEFYKRNHQWTDGFISAAKAVATAAKFILTAADKVVTMNGKFELLMVAAQETAASTAQLVVASRVKADKKSSNLQQLTAASKNVSTAVGTVVAIAEGCRQLVDEAEDLDTSNLTLHQAKKLEMEAQVKVLELEKELEEERLHLASLRRRHYQLAGEG
ncbi:huntingtin-interacting protein 1 isoform X2 [Coccinella septempunctata]|uniref:huntingtin-interacting protein 1 isoform X2 n=1 Tax=Coccinella septempunctata TaxID=41139 RepID=UPI001D05ED84|nr:huntingtin-interacting protein 1 isoform X2 [Coccinella septempunctata]